VRHIDRFEAEGLLRRDPDPTDRRVARISLTDAGRTRYEEIAAIAADVDRELRGLLTEREEKVVRSVLGRLRAHTSPPTPTLTIERDAE